MMQTFRQIGFVFVVVFCVFARNDFVVGANPCDFTFSSVQFIENGVPMSVSITLPNSGWSPSDTGWNGRNTVHGSQKIENMTPSSDFPFLNFITILPGQNTLSVLDITAEKVNAFWDSHLYFAGATRIGDPTWTSNCHGHSSGLNYWVNDASVLWDKDWKVIPANAVTVGCLFGDSSHSIKITEIESNEAPNPVITATTEKMAYAGTYLKTYSFPSGCSVSTSIRKSK